MARSRALYLIGPSGNPNFGDEFIAAAWLKYLAKVRPGTAVWLDYPSRGLRRFCSKEMRPRLRVTTESAPST